MLEVGVVECDDGPAERRARVRSIADLAEVTRGSDRCDDAERQRIGGVERRLVDGRTREPNGGIAGTDLKTDVLADISRHETGVEGRRHEQGGWSVDEVGRRIDARSAGPERRPCGRAANWRIHAAVENALNSGNIVGRLCDETRGRVNRDRVATENLGGVGRQDRASGQLIVDGTTGDVSDMPKAE